jgi:hypothetical protein
MNSMQQQQHLHQQQGMPTVPASSESSFKMLNNVILVVGLLLCTG